MATALRDMVLAGNWEAPMRARQMGEKATGEIVDLLTHETQQVRLVTVACLEEAGGERARTALIDALLSDDVRVCENAANALHSLPHPSTYDRLVRAFDTSSSSYVRQQIPLIIGRSDGKIADYSALVQRWEDATDEAELEGLTAGLARLGHEPAREQFVERLHSATKLKLDRYLKYCEYIGQKWLVNPLGPIIADDTKLRYIGPHGRDMDLRACDIAINLIAEISGRRFSFEVNGRTNYNKEQRAEVKKFADNYSS